MTRSFTDSENRTWKIALDPWLVTKVRDETNVLLTAWADEKFALAVKLRQEPWVLCDVLWAICEEQAAANGCKEAAEKNGVQLTREFARGLGGNTLLAAIDALEGGISDFFTSQELAQTMRVAMEKWKQAAKIAEQHQLEKATAIDPAQLAKNCIDSASSSPESSESIPLPEALRSAS